MDKDNVLSFEQYAALEYFRYVVDPEKVVYPERVARDAALFARALREELKED